MSRSYLDFDELGNRVNFFTKLRVKEHTNPVGK